MSLKKVTNVVIHETKESMESEASVETECLSSNEAFTEAICKDPPKPFTRTMCKLHMICLVGCLCCTMGGYDGTLFGGLLQNDQFKSYFGGTNKGIWVGIVSFLYQIGGVVAIVFTGPAIDVWGRTRGIFIGSMLVVVGAAIQGTSVYSHSIHQFMAGRFFLGVGAQISGAAAPIYIIEICHPAYRGKLTAIYNTFWWFGSIAASGAVRGSLDLHGNITWLLPIWLQLLCSGFICLTVLFLPESPRWLYVHDRSTQATAYLTKYHGAGNPNCIWVKLQAKEYEEHLSTNPTIYHWWNFRPLFRNRASLYRLACAILFNVMGQWTGEIILELLLSAVLDTAGIHNSTTQTNLSLGLSCLQFVVTTIGALQVDRLGRRRLFISANVSCALIWLALIPATVENSGKSILALIFLFKSVFAFGVTPLQALYPTEVFSFEMRAKGIAFAGAFTYGASLLNQFAWPVALDKIGWKTYIITMAWCLVQATITYFLLPETRNHTLEELDSVFEAKNPRKASTQRKKIHLSHSTKKMEAR